ncbi:MAG: hypothetical protein HC802_19625 [Caldilineaceae bacterium]|nr:hypothetical protein [Caldilineaceae bacterium]
MATNSAAQRRKAQGHEQRTKQGHADDEMNRAYAQHLRAQHVLHTDMQPHGEEQEDHAVVADDDQRRRRGHAKCREHQPCGQETDQNGQAQCFGP